MPSIIAVIPAKTHSNRMRHKNLRDMCGKPLYMYAVDTCAEAGVFERVYLSSDGILDTNLKATLHNRQMPLCGDVPSSQVVVEVLRDQYADQSQIPEWTCLVQPTSPCLRTETLASAAKRCGCDKDAIIAYSTKSMYKPCGAFYFMRSYLWLSAGSFAERLADLDEKERVVWRDIDDDEAIDVDCEDDWMAAEAALERRARG